MENISVSVITVTYNCADVLERTLQSVERQVGCQLQHVFVDGASTDGTLHLIDAYQQRNPHISVTTLSEPDKGLYDAMNKSMKLAQGRFIVFLNAGDCLHTDDVLQHVAEQDAGRVGVVYGQTNIVDGEGHFLHPRHHSAPEQLTSRSFLQGMLVCHQSFYVNRRIAPTYNLQYRFSADYDWCIRVMEACEKEGLTMVNLHSVLTDYLEEGLTTRNHRASLLERLRIMANHYGWLQALGSHLKIMIRKLPWYRF